VVVKLTWTGTDDPSCVGSSAQNVQVSSSGPGTSSSPPPSLRTLTVSLTGAGSGTVTDQNKSISCRPTCSHRFTSGAVVTLSAHPAAGSRFAGWRGAGCSGTGSCRVVMNDAKSVTAQFNRLPRETSKLRIGGAPEHGQGAGAVTGISAAPEQPGCTSELAFLADVGCSSTRLTVSGSIAQRASGHVLVTVYAWFGKRHGVGKISHGHWVVHLSVPGINQDPLAPKYLVVAHYAGNRAVKPGSVHRRVRIEVERPDLGGD
jgi:hypothetical protein